MKNENNNSDKRRPTEGERKALKKSAHAWHNSAQELRRAAFKLYDAVCYTCEPLPGFMYELRQKNENTDALSLERVEVVARFEEHGWEQMSYMKAVKRHEKRTKAHAKLIRKLIEPCPVEAVKAVEAMKTEASK